MQLSEHFELSEFTTSQTAARMGITITPTAAELANLRRVATILEVCRAALGRACHISSGLRPAAVNAAVGGSKTSAHLYGRAADTQWQGMTPAEAAKAISEIPDLPFDQIILEFDAWTHIGIPLIGVAPRRQLLTARTINGKTQYMPGLV